MMQRHRWLIHVLLWLVGYLLFFAVIFVDYGLQTALGRATANAALLIALFYANAWGLVNWYLDKGRYWSYAFWLVVLMGIISWARIEINHLFPSAKFEPLFDKDIQIIIFVGFSSVLVWLGSTAWQVLFNRQAAERRILRLERDHQEAQLQFLKSQINPHFLFNTLNNIYALSIVQPQQTTDAILQLSDLLRYAVYETRKESVSLAQEIAHLQRFIQLSQLHHPQPIQTDFKTEGDWEAHPIEPLLLLPLVENALKHSDHAINPQAFIRINISIQPAILRVEVCNSYTVADQQKDRVGGVGLDNISRRLALCYPDKHRLEIIRTPTTFSVLLEIQYG